MNLKPMSVAATAIESLVDRIGRATLWLALAMIALVAVNVLLRYALSVGSVWAQELEWHLLASLILLGMSHAVQRGDNVRVDLFYAGYSPAVKFAVDIVSLLLMLAVSIVFIRLSLGYVGQAWAIGEQSPDPGGLPFRWAVKALLPLGYGLLALQTVGALLRCVLDRQAAKEAARV